jgi:uncharacterized protein (TIGR00369 family)
MSFIKQPFDEFLGFEYERVKDGLVRLHLSIKPLYINSAGVVHGGVISTLADVAMSNLLEPDENGVQPAVTIDLHMTFLKGAKGNRMVAEASIVKTGRTMMYAECHIFNDEKELVAKAVGTFYRIVK